jgi:purine-binding chemotaxis protein CheW
MVVSGSFSIRLALSAWPTWTQQTHSQEWTMTTAVPRVARSAKRNRARFLTFVLGRDIYGVEILKVQEIIRMMEITAVPNMPPFLRGVINLRGEVVAIVDLRTKFGLPARPDTDRTCVIVLQFAVPDGGMVTRGVVVDKVAEVMDIADEQLAPPPSLGADVDVSSLKSIGKLDDRVVLILDVEKVLAPNDTLSPELANVAAPGSAKVEDDHVQ